MIELRLTPEFSHLYLQRLTDKQEYLLSLDGSALSTSLFVITFQTGGCVNVHIDTRLDYIHNKEVFTFTFRTQPYPFYTKQFLSRTDEDINTKHYIKYKYEKEQQVKKVAQFKQSRFDQINRQTKTAKPSKFFS